MAVGTGMGRHRVAGHQFLHARMATDKGRDNVEAAMARQIGDKKVIVPSSKREPPATRPLVWQVANDAAALHEAKDLLMRDMLALADRNGMSPQLTGAYDFLHNRSQTITIKDGIRNNFMQRHNNCAF